MELEIAIVAVVLLGALALLLAGRRSAHRQISREEIDR